ncbi:MAE_28990/MAE_18760 family HEPN-like nuclease [Paracoccus yeei]|uniref:MAE_28990/MAE_18760 family HEPN-like nuclease n=1 Tax=Paracoccus yeei TaxID=147645 RepID=UPI003BF920A7
MSSEDDFSQRLTEEISWRLRELSELVRACSDGSAVRRDTISRAALPLLYAHWEGYFVVSANAYLNFLTTKRLAISMLRDEFWALSVRRKFRPEQIGGEVNFSKFLMSIRSEPDRSFKRGGFEKINGKSNLNSDVLSYCCGIIGIDVSPFSGYFSFIDDNLISKRNFVAHGEALRFDPQNIPIFRDKVVELMRLCQTQFENAAHMRSYMRIP